MQYTIDGIKHCFDLLPMPRHIEFEGNTVTLPYVGRILESVEVGDGKCVLGMQLADDIESAMGIRWDVAKGKHWEAFIVIDIDPTLGSQEYRLETDERGVEIVGGDFEGARNGVETLRQIIRQCAPVLPLLSVHDSPEYKIRSYYLDVTRGRVPTLQWLKRWADCLCLYKYNQLQLYIEHSFVFDGLSETWRGVGALEPATIVEFDAYCAERGLELVPSVSTFGHLYQELRTRELRDMGELPGDADRAFSFIERQEHHTLNVTKPEAFDFSISLMDSYMELFTSRKFNIGADETFDLGKGASCKYAEEHGVAQMYAHYVTRLCEHLKKCGREPMLWGDIAVNLPQMLPLLPKDAMLLNWLYSPEVGEEEVKLLADSGLKQYVCCAVWCWNSLLPKVDYAWNNITRLAQSGIKYDAAGFMVTDWGDYGHVNDPHMALIGMIYGAQNGWCPSAEVTQEDMNCMISRCEFGDGTGQLVEAVCQASQCTAFGWDDAVRYLELDEGNGRLNQDVLRSLAYDGKNRDWMDDRDLDLQCARNHVLQELCPKLAEVERFNDDLSTAASHIANALAGARGSRAAYAGALLIAIEGQRLLNKFGLMLARQSGLLPGAHEFEDCCKLARQIEQWSEVYADGWRKISRESELNRVTSVIWRCADMLRR